MTRAPKTVPAGSLAVVVLQEMEAHKITQMVVVGDDHRPVGIVHLHDLVNAGLSREETP